MPDFILVFVASHRSDFAAALHDADAMHPQNTEENDIETSVHNFAESQTGYESKQCLILLDGASTAAHTRPTMGRRFQLVFSFLVAFSVVWILVSPAVPSPPTTIPRHDTIQRADISVQNAAMLPVTAVLDCSPESEIAPEQRDVAACDGTTIVDVTTARLC